MSETPDTVDVFLVSSPGGHLLELYSLRAAWSGYRILWVTADTGDARSLLRKERVEFARRQEPRSLRGLLPNLLLAWRLIGRFRPRVVITTGAAMAVPFTWIARMRGVDVIYVESATRIDDASVSCRLIAPVASRLYVQWPDLQPLIRGSRYAGGLLEADEGAR